MRKKSKFNWVEFAAIILLMLLIRAVLPLAYDAMIPTQEQQKELYGKKLHTYSLR